MLMNVDHVIAVGGVYILTTEAAENVVWWSDLIFAEQRLSNNEELSYYLKVTREDHDWILIGAGEDDSGEIGGVRMETNWLEC